jgi:hypothetical protein
MPDQQEEAAHPITTLKLNTERGVLFAEIAVPPMNQPSSWWPN